MKVITLSVTSNAAFPVTIPGANCNTLTDTGVMRSCISETFYNQLMLPWLLKAYCLLVTSASDSTTSTKGIIQCQFKLGGYSLEFNYIICRNLTRPFILGLDFM